MYVLHRVPNASIVHAVRWYIYTMYIYTCLNPPSPLNPSPRDSSIQTRTLFYISSRLSISSSSSLPVPPLLLFPHTCPALPQHNRTHNLAITSVLSTVSCHPPTYMSHDTHPLHHTNATPTDLEQTRLNPTQPNPTNVSRNGCFPLILKMCIVAA